MVFRTVKSRGSALRIFSYSAMAFCSLPCCTYFSAEESAFCLLKPNPKTIGCRLRSHVPPARFRCSGNSPPTVPPFASEQYDPTHRTGRDDPRHPHCKVVPAEPKVTEGYRGAVNVRLRRGLKSEREGPRRNEVGENPTFYGQTGEKRRKRHRNRQATWATNPRPIWN